MTPLIGDRYTSAKVLKGLDDLTNAWVADKLFIMIDEFKMGDADNVSKMTNLIKRFITEETLSMHAMRANQKDVKTYTNFLFCTNDDMIHLQEDDRRFNIYPPQEVKLLDRHPELSKNLYDQIQTELPDFAAFVHHYQVDTQEARSVRNTLDKEQVRLSAPLTTEDFIENLKRGVLDYFIDYLIDPPRINKELEVKAAYDAVVKQAISTALNKAEIQRLKLADIRVLYIRIFSKDIAIESLSKMLRLHRVQIPRLRVNNDHPARATKVRWKIKEYDADALIDQLFDSREQRSLGLRKVAAT